MFFPTSKRWYGHQFKFRKLQTHKLHIPPPSSIQVQHIFTQTTKNAKHIAIYTQSQNTLVPSHTFLLILGTCHGTYLGPYLGPPSSILPDARPTRRCHHERYLCSWNDVVIQHHRSKICRSMQKEKKCHECGHGKNPKFPRSSKDHVRSIL